MGTVTQVALLGGGRMGEALVGGFLDARWDPASIVVAEVDAGRRSALAERFPDTGVVEHAVDAVPGAGVIVVAVKPPDVPVVLAAAADRIPDDAVIVSIAAGVTTGAIEDVLPGRPVVRAMPNTPALVGEGAAAIAAGTHADDAALETAERILDAVGAVVRVPESMLDAVTGLSGSGPAYVFLLMEALVDAGESVGLPRDTAATLVTQTVLGAARMVHDGAGSPEELRAGVTSPGGTTQAGIASLEAAGFREAVRDAVATATRRSGELGEG